MSKESGFPVHVPAIRVEQPLGVFYVTTLSADLLLEVSYSDPLKITDRADLEGSYPMAGTQREESRAKLVEIGRFIETTEAAFPNSIILGANYNEQGQLEEDPNKRWHVKIEDGNNCHRLTIPSRAKLASIIDGQHRLHGFNFADSSKRSMELLCAIYLDLPSPYQAYLFATINFNQKKVDRSLAYLLFGSNLEHEPPESWSPEKTAVFLSRKLNTDQESPFNRHIKVVALDDEKLFGTNYADKGWMVSTATVVDGILKLFSSNPKRDRDTMHTKPIKEGRNRSILPDDDTPLRSLYKQTNDLAIYLTVRNYFTAVNKVFWEKALPKSYITKTVGIQALFDILRILLAKFFTNDKDVRVEYFKDHLQKAGDLDFASAPFQEASGKGRKAIRDSILQRLDLSS
jgi:DNA phosphorothioation-associated DGQHR protein 1